MAFTKIFENYLERNARVGYSGFHSKNHHLVPVSRRLYRFWIDNNLSNKDMLDRKRKIEISTELTLEEAWTIFSSLARNFYDANEAHLIGNPYKTKELLELGARAREGHPRVNGNTIHYTADLQTILKIVEKTIGSDSTLIQTIWLETDEGTDLRIKEPIEKTPEMYEIINKITASPARVIENLKTLDEALKNV